MQPIAVWVPIASVLVIYFARMAELRAKRDTVPGPVRERLTLRLFVTAGTLMFLGAIAEYWIGRKELEWVPYGVGMACGLGSFVLRRRAIAALGRFWSLHVEIRDNHEFVTSGPFRWVRHPTYFSMILELLAAAFILQAPWTLLAVAILFVPALVQRLRLEEHALVEKFGEAYRDYQRRTPAVLPYKWPTQ